MTTRLGIDEAGRGCVLGPMVFGALLVEADRELELKKLGAKDSKRLTKKKREALRGPLAEVSLGWKVVEIQPAEIDARSMGLLGKEAIVALIDHFRPDVVVLDAPVQPSGIPAFRSDLYARLEAIGVSVEIVAENKADDNHPCCSAASVFAKTERDARLKELEVAAGVPLGSGYPSDPVTQAWLRKVYIETGAFPHFVRTKWETCRRLVGDAAQGRLF
jgi:ribonuclease HII